MVRVRDRVRAGGECVILFEKQPPPPKKKRKRKRKKNSRKNPLVRKKLTSNCYKIN